MCSNKFTTKISYNINNVQCYLPFTSSWLRKVKKILVDLIYLNVLCARLTTATTNTTTATLLAVLATALVVVVVVVVVGLCMCVAYVYIHRFWKHLTFTCTFENKFWTKHPYLYSQKLSLIICAFARISIFNCVSSNENIYSLIIIACVHISSILFWMKIILSIWILQPM
jgi:hypothetical protein